MNTLQRIAATMLLTGAAVAAANAQNWGETQGSSVVRGSPSAISTRYDRPALFFLGRAQRSLPPRFAFSYPFLSSRLEVGNRYMAIEFGNRTDTVASIRGRRVATVISGRR